MITKQFLEIIALIVACKNKKLQCELLGVLAKFSLFKKCIREVIKNCSARRKKLTRMKLDRYNSLLHKIIDRKVPKRVKVKLYRKIAPFLTAVYPFVKKVLHQDAIQEETRDDGRKSKKNRKQTAE